MNLRTSSHNTGIKNSNYNNQISTREQNNHANAITISSLLRYKMVHSFNKLFYSINEQYVDIG